ncbi:MAG: HDIG domain-containing protein [Labilithrix sp.]|nr:HDIG domain-containing protein [Labilithrix sp.]MCW5816431.1 HDIG domain-containing protein [Labilithrix sp.]
MRQAASEIHDKEAEAILREIGAPERLIRHGELVDEAAEEVLAAVMTLVAVDGRLVRLGARLHDAGKALQELDQSGRRHEDDGGALLLRHGVDERVARMCRTPCAVARRVRGDDRGVARRTGRLSLEGTTR